MYFVAGMQPLHHLTGADLASAIGWMQEARADPEDSHSAFFTQRSSYDLYPAGRYLHEAFIDLLAAPGEEHVAPDLQVQQAPDAVGLVVQAAFVLVEQVIKVRHVDVAR